MVKDILSEKYLQSPSLFLNSGIKRNDHSELNLNFLHRTSPIGRPLEANLLFWNALRLLFASKSVPLPGFSLLCWLDSKSINVILSAFSQGRLRTRLVCRKPLLAVNSKAKPLRYHQRHWWHLINYCTCWIKGDAVMKVRRLFVTWYHNSRDRFRMSRRPKRNPNLELPFLKLPIDLILEIADLLPLSGLAALSISCKSLMTVLGRQHLRALSEAPESERRAYLYLLERERRGQWACHTCIKLHAIYPNDSPMTLNWEKIPCVARPVIYGYQNYKLAYHHVRLVVNYQLLGSCHGLPLQGMSMSSTRVLPSKLEQTFTSNARIRSNELILNIQYKYTTKEHGQIISLRSLDGAWVMICKHQLFIQNARSHTTPRDGMYNFVRDGLREAEKYGAWLSTVRSCPFCPTDFRLLFTEKEFTVEVWRNFGSGRSPLDNTWRSQSQFPDLGLFDYKHGSVHAAYNGLGANSHRPSKIPRDVVTT